MYQALYRKWRPRDFDSVVGQEHITTTLKHEIADGKFAHAYLFTGSRGTGKTSCAKIIAKAVNCENPREGNPCNECPTCVGIDDGSVLDVVEIDAASNNGVDNIRQLREEAYFLPVAAKYRVYILDECHMLSVGAVNALLKILEEPPAHVMFILATTEAHKVLPTILSRCQRFDFKRIKSAVIAQHLTDICSKEGIAIDDDAALLIARLCDGGMRDALSLLELCVSYQSTITAEAVVQASGLVGQENVFRLVDALIAEDPVAAISVVEFLSENSIDFARLCEQLITHMRNVMVVKSVSDPDELVPGTQEELALLRGQAQKVNLSRILAVLDILQDTAGRMSRTSFKRTELEMALIRICNLSSALPGGAGDSPEVAKLAARISALEQAFLKGPAGATLPTGPTAPTGTAEQQAAQTPKRKQAEPKQPQDALEQSAPPPPEEAPPTPMVDGDAAAVRPFSQWPQVMTILQKKNPALYGAMIDSRAFISGGTMLVDCKNDLFLSLLRTSPAAKESLRDSIFDVTGEKYNLGPYKAEKHAVAQAADDPLKEMLKKAAELDVPVDLK